MIILIHFLKFKEKYIKRQIIISSQISTNKNINLLFITNP